MKTQLLAFALLAGLFASSVALPVPSPSTYHAFCRTQWLFASTCTEISTTIMQQILDFSPLSGCDLCQYALVSSTPYTIKANHTSYDDSMESIEFNFSPTVGGCRVDAQSVSMEFTPLLDGGLNYCNLNNVLSASGLYSSPGFMEMTNEWACLGYGIANCDDGKQSV